MKASVLIGVVALTCACGGGPRSSRSSDGAGPPSNASGGSAQAGSTQAGSAQTGSAQTGAAQTGSGAPTSSPADRNAAGNAASQTVTLVGCLMESGGLGATGTSGSR